MSRMDADNTDRLQKIADRFEILDILTLYCTALDTKRFDLLDSVFAADAMLDYTSAGGIRGTRDEVKSWLRGVLSLFPVTQHLVTNFSIEIFGRY